MKGLIINNPYFNDEEYLYQSKRLKEELELKGVKTDIIRNDSFVVKIDNGEIVSAVKEYDFVVFWDKDKYVLDMLNKIGMPTYNSFQAITDCDDKMTTYIKLANNDIAIPKTLAGLMCFDKRAKIEIGTAIKIEKELSYPIVAKYSYGSLGKGVFLANNREELLAVMEKLKCSPHLFQQCIKSSYGRDVRIIVIGDKVVGGMLRRGKDFCSNVGAGGVAEVYNLDENIRALAIKIKNLLGLDYCGIDILFGENGPVVCEVNSNAFFYTFEKVTKINVAKIYAEYIIEKNTKLGK